MLFLCSSTDIRVDHSRIKVKKFRAKPTQCHNCYEYGHIRKYPNEDSTKCKVCSRVNLCEKTCEKEEFCFHCDGNHSPASRWCPRYRFKEEVVETANNEHISIGSAKRIVMAANSSENSTYTSAIKKLKNVENNTVRSLKSKGTGSRLPRGENSPSPNNASVGNVVEANPVSQLASSPPLPSLDVVIENEVMQEEWPVKPQSKDHAVAVKKSNPGKEKRQQIKPEGKANKVSSSEGMETLPPQSDFVEPDSKKRCRHASPS